MKNVNPIQAAPIVVLFMLVTAACLAAQPAAPGMSPAAAEAKAREIEAKMTDDERFGLIKNLMVVNFRTRQCLLAFLNWPVGPPACQDSAFPIWR